MLRVIDIFGVLLKYRIDEYLFRNPSTQFLFRAAAGFRGLLGLEQIRGSIGTRVRLALQELGPVFIKFGQLLASRPDIVPAHLIRELALLRDSVEPFEYDQVVRIIKQDFGKDLKSMFSKFDKQPVAAGSVAQVHFAELCNGEEVAVKILRPNIKQIILQDIEMFRQAAAFLELYKPDLKQFKVQKIIDELAHSIIQELNLKTEADHICRFARNMQDCDYIRVPKVYLCSDHVLVMERMQGTPLDQVDTLRAQSVDINQVVLQGVEALMLQIFRDGFFHADQHPGNLWIQSDGSRVYLDFGIMGEISDSDRKTLLKILYNLYSKNYQKIIEAVSDAGWVTVIDNVPQFEKDIATVGMLFVDRKQKDLSFGVAINQLLRTFEKYQINVPYQFTLLCKTILQIEGSSKTLAPDLNLQKVTTPILLKHFAKKR